MFLIEAPDGGPVDLRIVGALPDHLARTLWAIHPRDTNETLAERLGLNLTTCSNRTDRLAKLRLLRKQRRQGALGYKQFEFFPVLQNASPDA
jgi:DNA-binding IclR family transcriptional regulator